MPAPIVLLGPQRLRPTLAEALEVLDVPGPIAAITAGWEEREEEIDELSEHVGRKVVNLRLHGRTEEAFHEDAEFLEHYQARRRRLRELQKLHRRRLTHQLKALLELMELGGTPDVLEAHRTEALEAVRRLDDEHLHRMAAEHEAVDPRWLAERDGLREHRAEVVSQVGDCAAVAIAGGNVEALIHRLHLFGMGPLLAERPLIAWSAGAMAVSERIVLYHDTPPQGLGYPEVHGPGLGLVRGILPLPHAHRRLRLDDRQRVRLFARRFAPFQCLAFADGARAMCSAEGQWQFGEGVRRLTADGDVVPGAGESS